MKCLNQKLDSFSFVEEISIQLGQIIWQLTNIFTMKTNGKASVKFNQSVDINGLVTGDRWNEAIKFTHKSFTTVHC